MAENNSKQDQTPEEEIFNKALNRMLQDPISQFNNMKQAGLAQALQESGAIDAQLTIESYNLLEDKKYEVLASATKFLEKKEKLNIIGKVEESIKESVKSAKEQLLKHIEEKSPTSKDIVDAIRKDNQEGINNLLVDDMLKKTSNELEKIKQDSLHKDGAIDAQSVVQCYDLLTEKTDYFLGQIKKYSEKYKQKLRIEELEEAIKLAKSDLLNHIKEKSPTSQGIVTAIIENNQQEINNLLVDNMLKKTSNELEKIKQDSLPKDGAIDAQSAVQCYNLLTKKTNYFLDQIKKNSEKHSYKPETRRLEEAIESAKSDILDYIVGKSTTTQGIVKNIREGNKKKVNEFLVDELLTKAIKDSNLTARSDKISKILKPVLVALETDKLTKKDFAKQVTQYLKEGVHPSEKNPFINTIPTKRLYEIAEKLNIYYSQTKQNATIKAINDAKNVKDLEEAFKEENNSYRDELKKLGTGKITDSEKARAKSLAEEYKRLLDNKIEFYKKNQEKESEDNPKLLLEFLLKLEKDTFQKSFKDPSVFKEEPKQKVKNKGSLASKAKNTIGKIKEQFDKMKLPKSLGDNVKAKFNKAKSKEDGRSQ